jgi:hypothetical protein
MSESKIKLSSPLNLRIYRITSFIATPTRFSFPPLHRPWHPSLPRVQDSKLKTQHRERRWFGKTAPNNALPRSRCVRPGWRACHRDDLTDREQPRSPGPNRPAPRTRTLISIFAPRFCSSPLFHPPTSSKKKARKFLAAVRVIRLRSLHLGPSSSL